VSVPDTTTAKALHQRMRERIAALPPLVSDPRNLPSVPMDFSCASTIRAARAEREQAAEEREWERRS